MEIGEKIRRERKSMKLTLEELATRVGISKMTLHRIETGKTSPSIAVLGDISQALHKPISSFIEEDHGYIKISRLNKQFIQEGKDLTSRVLSPRGSLKVPKDASIAIYYVEAKDGAEVQTHRNRGFEWVFQISGKCEIYYDKKKYLSGAGDVFFYDGRRPHSAKYYGKNTFILVSFK